ncbi:hydroxyacylglutathione hydrolase [Flocculibacter collagenilyticus]|uniref:hydroxyacylglutathione hydrolase n=1 Tax=Flocculibacter collagenilyticus TaxID=2744479 RepID=UPI0018F5F00B|nr:hydroxyacylglutathione hydrolase [Flocculibacter collagenilyticus]
MYQVIPIAAFSDNYIWCLINNNNAVVVDPGDAKPVLQFLQEEQLTLTAILVTHHHWDHTDGIEALLTAYPGITVYGPYNPSIDGLTHRLKEHDEIEIKSIEASFKILEVPGHTLDHIAYFDSTNLFCGDTLFSGGCGRLFEGTPEQMHHSLTKLTQLPDSTKVYCTHEYTKANLMFALAVEPNNAALSDYRDQVVELRNKEVPTLPSNIKLEKEINPFLRSAISSIKEHCEQHTGHELNSEIAVFAATRKWKDNF